MGRAPCCDKANVKRGPWSPDEDMKLKEFIEKHGTGGNWIALPHKAGLKRCGKSCRLRWLNYLRPNIKHGEFSDAEDRMICNLFATIGSRWSIIAGHLPGRTDNDIKNYWNTKLKKKLLGIAPSQRTKAQSHRHQQQQQQLQLQQQPLQQAFPSASFQLPSVEPTSSPPSLVQIPSAKSCMSTFLDAFQISHTELCHNGGLTSTSLVHGPSTSQQQYSQNAGNLANAVSVFGSGSEYNSNPKLGYEHEGIAAAADGLVWQQASFESLLCNNGLGENQKLLLSDITGETSGQLQGEGGESTAPWGEVAAPILEDYYINANYEEMRQLMITSSSASSGCTNLFYDDPGTATIAGGNHKSQERAMYHYSSL